MGLKVWLPLNGDLHNLGCTDIVVNNTGATVDNNGKIGKCYSFSSKALYGDIPNFNNYTQISGCCWAYLTNLNSAQYFIHCGGQSSYPCKFSIDYEGSIRFQINGTEYTSGITLTTNTWYHITVTWDGSTAKLYINGIEKSSKSAAGSFSASNHFAIGARTNGTAGNTFAYYITNAGKLNDIRIYNHALSTAEIKEISLGLILHYKLDSFLSGYGNPNLALGSHTLETTATISNTYISKRGAATLGVKDGFAQVIGTAAWQGFSLWSNSLNLQIGTTYTYSFYAYTKLSTSTNAAISFYPMMYNSAGTRDTTSKLPISVMGGTFTEVNAKLIGTLSTIPKLYWATFTWNQTMADILTNGGKIELSILIHGTFNEGRIDYLWAPKLEIGNTPTSWSPAISESSFNVILDCSGYEHNGILNDTTAQISTNTVRYSAALLTSLTNNSDTYPIKGECNMPESSALTFTWWMKPTTIGYLISGIFSTSNNDTPTDYSTTAAHMRDSCFDCCNVNGTCVHINVASYLTTNEWHHYTLTYNGSLLNFYKDGVSKVTLAQTGALKAFKYIFPFYSKAGGSSRTTSGYLSDFRIYCTALSADDILQLYHTSAKIDNQLNLHTFEVKETTNGRELVDWNFTTGYTNHTTLWNNFDENGEVTLTGNSHLGSAYIKINPQGKKYYFDADISVDANNQVYIGFQRYDAAKTSRSNDATMYTVNVKPSTALVHLHYHGIYDATVGGSNFGYFDANTPVDTISVRILNDWSSANSRKMTIHSLSLREVSTLDNSKINKYGQAISDLFIETTDTRVQKNGLIESNEFIEL